MVVSWATAKPKKCHLVPQNGPGSLGLEKSWKKCQTEITFFEPVEQVGGHRYPPRSIPKVQVVDCVNIPKTIDGNMTPHTSLYKI